jgi:DNA-binding CsgD family transcriptional regulator
MPFSPFGVCAGWKAAVTLPLSLRGMQIVIETQRHVGAYPKAIHESDSSHPSVGGTRGAEDDLATWWLEQSGKFIKANRKAYEVQSTSALVTFSKAGELLFAATPLHRYLRPDLHPGARRTALVESQDGAAIWRLDFQNLGPHILCQARPVDARTGEGNVMLMSCFGLTWTESRVASLLLTGGETEALAEKMGISVLTFRTHRKRVFAKMGIKARSALQAKVIAWLVG